MPRGPHRHAHELTAATMRVPHLGPRDLDAEQRALYDTLTAGDRAAAHAALPAAVQLTDAEGRLQGPFNALLLAPRLGSALAELSRQLRFDSGLAPATREIVILVVAASEQSDFEWAVHAAIASTLGVPADIIAALAAEEPIDFDDPVEQAAALLARSLVNHSDIDDETYQRVQHDLGDTGIFEVSTTVGVYQLYAQQMRLFRVPAPPGPWRR